jgi:hypothetical protein
MSTSACIFGPPGGRCARVSPARNRPRTIRSYRARHLHRCRWLSGQRGGLSRGGPLRAQGYCQLYKSRLGVYPLSGVCKSSNPESWPLLGIRTFENRSNHPYLPLVFEIPPVKLTVPLERPLVIPFLGSFAESPAAEVVLHMPKWAPRLSVKGSVPVHTTPMQYGGIVQSLDAVVQVNLLPARIASSIPRSLNRRLRPIHTVNGRCFACR